MINDELIKRILSSIMLIPLVLFFIIQGSFLFNFFIIICFLISSYEWIKISKKFLYKILGLFFLIFSFYTIFKIRIEFEENYFYLLFVILICISTDIGGFVFGKIFKGPKLTKISPNKTISGSFGGFLLSILSIKVFLYYYSDLIFFKFSQEIFLFIIIISFISQIGDIIISFFKRKSKIKNTGNIIPGHGGILDRIDGMIFAFPFSYFLFLNWNF